MSLNDVIMDNYYFFITHFFASPTMSIKFFYNRGKIFNFLKPKLSERGTNIKENSQYLKRLSQF